MNTPRSDWCGYEWPRDCDRVDIHTDEAIHQSCCIREPVEDAERCVWHVDPKETDVKTAEALTDARESEEIAGRTSPYYSKLLDGAVLQELDLGSIDLAGTSLRGANFAGADLPGATLHGADLSGALLGGANISDATMTRADLTGAYLANADLSGSYLDWADLSRANLSRADLSRVLLGGTTLSNVQIDTSTQFNRRIRPTYGPSLRQMWRPAFFGKWFLDWDLHAQDSHKLSVKCSEEGLIGHARTLVIWNRRARRMSALVEGKILTAVGSWLNWQATGHGISVRRVSRNILFLFVVSTAIYLLFGIRSSEEAIPIEILLSRPFLTTDVVDVLYFSVVTFTTSPPVPVSDVSVGVSQWTAMVETFLGTLLLVLLGYVLGSREQI